MCWGENIRSRPDLLPKASKTERLLKNSFIVVSHHAQAVVPRTNMSAEQWNQSRNDTADVAASETVDCCAVME